MGKRKRKPKDFTVPKTMGRSLVFSCKRNGQVFTVRYAPDHFNRDRVTPHDKFYVDEIEVEVSKWCDCVLDNDWFMPKDLRCQHSLATLKLDKIGDSNGELMNLLPNEFAENEYERLLAHNELLGDILNYVEDNRNKYYDFFWTTVKGLSIQTRKTNQKKRRMYE